MNIRFLFCALLISFISSRGYGQPDFIKFRHIGIEEGLSNNQIHSICKDHKGFLWFGTMSGLNRYDGYDFKIFKHDPKDSTSLRDNFVLKILEDQEDYLWILSRNSSLCFYNPVKDVFVSDRPLMKKNISIPKNYISDINEDSNGRIWVTNSFFGIYIYDFQSDSVIYLKNEPGNSKTISFNSISSMAEDSRGDYWIVNQQGIIEKLDYKSLKVKERVSIFSEEIDESENFRLFVDSDDDVWIYSESKGLGIKRLSALTQKIYTYSKYNGDFSITNNVVKGIIQDKDGLIYIGMDHGGLNVINKKFNSVAVVQNKKGDPTSMPENSITTMYYDDSDIMWIGTYKSGLVYYHPDFFKFDRYTNNPLAPQSLPFSDVNCFTEDEKGRIWIGSNGGGLIRFNAEERSFKKVKYSSKTPNVVGKDVIMSLLLDSKHRLWVGTYFGGLTLMNGNKFTHYKHSSEDVNSISNDRIWDVFEDSKGNIWIGTLGGGVDLWNSATSGFRHYKSGDLQSISSDYVYSIEEDNDGNIWFGTIYGVNVLDWSSQRFFKFLNNSGNEKSLSNNKVLVVKCDSRGWIWIGTSDGLNLFDASTNSFRIFRKNNGLPDNMILSIEEDEKGDLWMGTPNGLANMQIRKMKSVWDFDFVFYNYDKSDGLQGNIFNERASLKTKSGNLMFGGVDGFNVFDPQKVIYSNNKKKLVFLQFELFNEVVNPGESIEGRKILDESITTAKSLDLKHDENFFSISFAALDFFYPQKLLYQYRLDGFSESWFNVSPWSRKATFTNLDHGSYQFRVRVSEDGKTWSEKKDPLMIHIMPPVWASKWAMSMYALIVFVLLFSLRHIVLNLERVKHQRENAKKDQARKEELNKLKTKFFTNVSHEYRTLLTLILSPLGKIIINTPDEGNKTQLQLVERNAKRLMNMVNQLLDFRKMEVDQLTLNPSIGDMVCFVKDKIDSFSDFAIEKNIQLVFNSKTDSIQCFFDHDKLEKVLFNLLSNAFKFTQENGVVAVELTHEKDKNNGVSELLIIKVKDSGIGITPDKLEQIFERFYQDQPLSENRYPGSGIGLSLTKEFVQLHGGEISVTSKVGHGSCFSVCLPVCTTIQESPDIKLFETQDRLSSLSELKNETQQNETLSTILIVEDNDDLRFYLQDNLKKHYNIVDTSNGQNAWALIEEYSPELIVSDVMMPVMSGIELCEKIKKDNRFSHIPVILLTARSTKEQKLEGLHVGADDYITKPFSYEILEVKIKNILAYRKKLQSRFINSKDIKPSDLCVSSLDEKFFRKALEVVENNMGESEFTVEKMGQLMGVSRAHLYNKLVGITGKNPSEFIRIMRLKRGAQLLEESQFTIAEISYEVGYNGPRYFTKHFKEFYGETPSKYIKSKKQRLR